MRRRVLCTAAERLGCAGGGKGLAAGMFDVCDQRFSIIRQSPCPVVSV
jgi:hypothetical protein